MKKFRSARDAGLALLCWAGGYFGFVMVAHGLSCANACAIVVGWWLTAYLSSLVGFSIFSAVLVIIIYAVVFVVACFLGETWFYHDIDGINASTCLVLGLAQGALVASPIMFDYIVKKVAVSVFARSQAGRPQP